MKTNNVKFGFNQLFHPTPEAAKKAFRIFFYFTGIITFVLVKATMFPPEVKLQIADFVVNINMVAHLISRMFGIQVEEDPIKDSA